MNGPAHYLEWSPQPALRRYVACTWTGGLDRAKGREQPAEPVLPDGCMDVIWDGLRLFVAGPDLGPTPDTHEGGFTVGLRWRPGAGPLFLGLPADRLLDARVDLDRLWPEAGALAERLSETSSLRQAASVLEEHVLGRLPDSVGPDPLVEAAATEWRHGDSRLSPSAVAERSGLTGRQVHRRFVVAVGYGPKTLQRVLRFQSFLGRSAAEPERALADLAFASGYADQSHLTRETGRLAGLTPTALLAARRGEVRNVQDSGGVDVVQRHHGTDQLR